MSTVVSPSLIVAKFGGTSVADYHAMSRCTDIIISNPTINIVVVSASAGITNLLIALAQGQPLEIRKQYLNKIATTQENILANLPYNTPIRANIDQLMNNISALADAASLATSPALTDELVSHGELLSSYLFTEVLKQKQAPAKWFDVRQVMRTDATFGKAVPQIKEIKQLCWAYLKSQIMTQIIVTQGFIGSDADGRTTTFGRGGSDYSAALLGEAMEAKQIAILSDVAGIYTTDPRIVPTAKRIDNITFSEAAEMATFGAKILHPATLIPALRSNISVFVGSSQEKEAKGTLVCSAKYCKSELPQFRTLSMRKNQIRLTLRCTDGRHSSHFLARVFGIVAAHHISVHLVSTSEISITLILDPSGDKTGGTYPLFSSVLNKLAEFCEIEIEENLALIALIGNQLSTKGAVATIFNVLAPFPVRLSCCGTSQHSIRILANDGDADTIINVLHNQLFE